MAESSLSLDINSLRTEVGRFLGWGRTISNWSTTQLNDFDDISRRALREFYYPAIDANTPIYEWSFLRKLNTVTLGTNDIDYTMPDDFSGTILDNSVAYVTAGQNQLPMVKVSESDIRKLHASDSTTKAFPKYYAIRNRNHDPTVGQRWEMTIYPKPSSAVNGVQIEFRYVFIPNELTNTNIYPVGGAMYSEVILASHLAQAEATIDSDPNGPYSERFRALLAQAVRNDIQQKANARGGDA